MNPSPSAMTRSCNKASPKSDVHGLSNRRNLILIVDFHNERNYQENFTGRESRQALNAEVLSL